MKLTNPLLLIVLLCLATGIGCGLRKKKEKESFQTPLEQYRDEDFYARQGPLADTGKLNLVVLRYQAQYDNDFSPTINFQVQNTGSKTVTSFEVQANLGTTKSFFDACIFRKSYKDSIAPGEAASYSYKVVMENAKESCNDYPSFEVVREICSDGTMNRKNVF